MRLTLRQCLSLLGALTLWLAQPLLGAPALADAPTIYVPSQMSLTSAITNVANGGAIEIASGTYAAPANGFNFGNLGKSFTVRAAPGATVVLSGSGSTRVMRFQNSSVAGNGLIRFENLTFANGYSNVEGLAGGATLDKAQAIFINCVFRDNSAVGNVTLGGGIYLANSPAVTFSSCLWQNNSSRAGGAGLAIRDNSVVTVSNSQFLNNRANLPNHTLVPTGGAINMGNATLYIDNTRFEGNTAGGHGGAIEIIGNWQQPYSTPHAYALISNSTFVNNLARNDPSVSQTFPNEGGAIAIEDQSYVQLIDSRFVTNTAEIGGAITLYRGRLEVTRSTFLGNQAQGTSPANGAGGAISMTSGDNPSDGSNNRPAAQLTVDASYFQGRYGAVTSTAFWGGCIGSYGDGSRINTPDNDGVPNTGTVADNRAQVTIQNTLFNDCDARQPAPDSAAGGGLMAGLTNLNIQSSLFVNSDALGEGQWGSGGALAIVDRTLLNLTGSSFARNTSNRLGAAIFAQGSDINISTSQFFENEITPGVTEQPWESYGAAIFTGPDDYRGLPATGLVQNNVFSNNLGVDIFDDDRNNGPINSTRYNSNQFFSSDYSNAIYSDALDCCKTVSGLNSLVVNRTNGTSTDKSTVNNTALGSAPALGHILATPPMIFQPAAAGDPGPATAYIGYAWSGGTAEINGAGAAGHVGLTTTTGATTFTLLVGGTPFTAQVTAVSPRIFIPLVVQ